MQMLGKSFVQNRAGQERSSSPHDHGQELVMKLTLQ
jgi:hypothetical protein